jgi:CubicO group peptidase (beta-lactamase class C family)/peptidoglycan/LPS O-acetylase OafA/YrhL
MPHPVLEQAEPTTLRRAVARTSSDNTRESALDAIRAIATVRVVVWHAFGVAAITYFVAAIPAMFFVTGSLLAKSFDRRRWPTVLRDRFRRLLLPLWMLALAAWIAMVVAAHRTGTTVPWQRLPAWILPLGDPHGSAWEAGWMSSPLWYIRAVVWLMIASPILRWATRRYRRAALGLPITVVFALDVVGRHPTWTVAAAPRLVWQIGDFALYAVFLMGGFLHRDGLFAAVSPRRWVTFALSFGAAAAAWRVTQPVPLGVVNNSHPLHLFVGAAWLALALAAQPLLAAAVSLRVVGPAIRFVAQRAYTIYLWHTTAIIIALNLVDGHRYPYGLRSVSLLVWVTIGTAIAVALCGWIEDMAAGRPARLWPSQPVVTPARRSMLVRIAVPAFVSLTAVVVPLALPQSATTAAASSRPPTPSQQPPRPTFTAVTDVAALASPFVPVLPAAGSPAAVADTSSAADTATMLPELLERDAIAAALQDDLDRWAVANNVPGAVVGIARGYDVLWSGATGMRLADGKRTAVTDALEIMSVTKLFTAALVYHFADAGMIDLDAPLPPLHAVPGLHLDSRITSRQLLSHRSGLVNYRATPQYVANPAAIDTPSKALLATGSQPLLFAPGTAYDYSSSNYLALGFLLEQITGKTFDQLLEQVLLDPLGLDHTSHRGPGPGEPAQATAGIVTTISDLAAAGTAILRDHFGMSAAAHAQMTGIDPATGAGAGSFGFCPCVIGANGLPQFFAVGHFGGTTLVVYAPVVGLTMVLDVTDSLWPDGRLDAITAELVALGAMAAGL